MTRAFFLKDLRLASRIGAPLPGLGSLLALQGIVCLALAGYSISIGPLPPQVWRGAASLLTTLAFVLAFIAPATNAAIAASSEGNPDIAESLSTAPLGPTQFLLGKAALPAVQGFALQAALLPAWAFLTANGLLSISTVVRIVTVMVIAIPVSALSGAGRFGGLGAPRMAMLLKAAAKRGVTTSPLSTAPAQQTWIAMLGMAWVVQVMRGAGGGLPWASSSLSGAVQDLVRPVVPFVGLERGAFVPLFGVPAPVILLSVFLFGAFGVSRIASSVAASPRASGAERERSWRALTAARAVVVLYLAGAVWAISPAASAAAAGCMAVFYGLSGTPVLEGRLRIAAASLVPCVLPAVATTVTAGLPGLGCWLGIAAVCASASAALPPPRPVGDRRTTGAIFVIASGIAPPLLAVAFSLPSPLRAFASFVPVLAAWSWISLPAAVLSLASKLLGPLRAWSILEASAPSLYSVPPWLAAPAVFGLVALLALARSSLQKRRTAPEVG